MELVNFGLGAVLIAIFFIPLVNKLMNIIQSKDVEIAKLNAVISELQGQRINDMREVVGITVEPIKEFKGTAQALFQLVGRNRDGTKQ